jgi:hypothetical protein
MKEKIILWVLNKLLNMTDTEIQEDLYKEKINTLIFRLYKNSMVPQLLDREINAMLFNAKYTDTLNDLGIDKITPSQLLTTYYNLSNKGDTSFMKEKFYRVLVQSGDNEVRKLRYRIKRNQ